MRARDQLGQADVFGAQRQQGRVGVRVETQQFATEARHDFAEGGADLSGANHPDSLAHHIKPGQAVQGEIAFTGAVVGAVQATVERQNQRHGVLGHGMGRVRRYAHHAQAPGGGQVDMVVTGRTQGNQACFAKGQLLQHRGAQVVIDEGADHLVVMGQGHGVEVQARGLEVQLKVVVMRGSGEAVAVVGLAAEQKDAHGSLPRLSAESVKRRFGLQRQGGRWRDRARPVRRTRWGSPA